MHPAIRNAGLVGIGYAAGLLRVEKHAWKGVKFVGAKIGGLFNKSKPEDEAPGSDEDKG
jgi:hypothetical protein